MNKQEVDDLKRKIYQQVEQIDNETTLHMLEEAVSAYSSISKSDIIDELTEDQKKRLDQSISQSDNGNTTDNEEVKKISREWLSK
ncbi:MAG: hypothetical protein KAY50_08775 [Chitinophagaceae bacterium]|nr:hypothetical protein [Chitinophagaceae bacterium]